MISSLCPSFIKIASNVTELCSGERHKQTDRHNENSGHCWRPRTNKKLKWVWLRPQGAWDTPLTKRHNQTMISSLCPSFIKIASDVTELCSGESHKQTDKPVGDEGSARIEVLDTMLFILTDPPTKIHCQDVLVHIQLIVPLPGKIFSYCVFCQLVHLAYSRNWHPSEWRWRKV